MTVVLFNIPLVRWVRKTMKGMDAAGKEDFATWSNCWFRAYEDLGGDSSSSGSKECPKHAAYGLWWLGRISNSGRMFQDWTLERVNNELGKNAAYAVLALDLLDREFRKTGAKADWTKAELWARVQELYLKKLGQPPAQTEQGAVKVAMGLFAEGQTIGGSL